MHAIFWMGVFFFFLFGEARCAPDEELQDDLGKRRKISSPSFLASSHSSHTLPHDSQDNSSLSHVLPTSFVPLGKEDPQDLDQEEAAPAAEGSEEAWEDISGEEKEEETPDSSIPRNRGRQRGPRSALMDTLHTMTRAHRAAFFSNLTATERALLSIEETSYNLRGVKLSGGDSQEEEEEWEDVSGEESEVGSLSEEFSDEESTSGASQNTTASRLRAQLDQQNGRIRFLERALSLVSREDASSDTSSERNPVRGELGLDVASPNYTETVTINGERVCAALVAYGDDGKPYLPGNVLDSSTEGSDGEESSEDQNSELDLPTLRRLIEDGADVEIEEESDDASDDASTLGYGEFLAHEGFANAEDDEGGDNEEGDFEEESDNGLFSEGL